MSLTIGYHCSHEQHPPSRLLANLRAAEAAGFGAAMCSDHFAPFGHAQGESGFAWTWLGAALATSKLSFGTVTAPGQRYHPAIVAQAAATVADLFPGRFWWALGTGQAINEQITGEQWPTKAERRARLRECVDVIRALFRGETVTHRGLVTLREAQLYSRPQQPPPLIGAAISAETAAWVGGWADGLITICRPQKELREVVDAFRRGGGEGKPMYLQSALSYAPNEAEAEAIALAQWRTNMLAAPELVTDLATPTLLDAAAAYVGPEQARARLRISASLAQHAAWIAEDAALGFERIFLHHVGVGPDQRGFIDDFARVVLPQFRG
ncbi:MAG TPA: TIGR03885 family FMN-dependent LLM class oxidoreductase [Polyangia bacterium]